MGAFGLSGDGDSRLRLNWILIHPASHGSGVGSQIMQWVLDRGNSGGVELILIAASHKSEAFFRRFGAERVLHIPDGWGNGMDRVDMELTL